MNYDAFHRKRFTLELDGRELAGLFGALVADEAGLDDAQTRVLQRVRQSLYDELSIEGVENLVTASRGAKRPRTERQ